MKALLLLFFVPFPAFALAQPVYQVGASAAIPVSEALSDYWHTGVGGHADVSFPLKGYVRFVFAGQAHRFKLDKKAIRDEAGGSFDIEGGNVQIIGAFAGLRYFDRRQRTTAYGELLAGPVLTRFREASTGNVFGRFIERSRSDYAVALSVGLGVSLPLSQRLRLGLGPHLVYVLDDGERNIAPLRAVLIIL